MAGEAFDWLFIDNLPLPFEKKRMAKQSQIETWLDLAQILRELGIEKRIQESNTSSSASYVV